MANKYWIGGDATYPNRWNVAANWSGAAVPGNGDTCYFDSRAGDDTGTGKKYSCTEYGSSDYDVSVKTGLTLIVSGDYDGEIGASAHPLLMNLTKLIYRGEGNAYITLKEASADHTCDLVYVKTTAGTLTLASTQNDGTYVHKWAEVFVHSGTLTVSNSTALTKLRMITSSAAVTIGYGCKDVKNSDTMEIHIANGALITDSNFDLLVAFAGTVQIGNAALSNKDPLHSNIYNYGATINWQSNDDTDTPQLNTAFICGGSLNGLGLDDKQVGSGSGEDITVFDDGTVDFSESAGAIALGTNSKVITYGGTFIGQNNELSW